MPSEKDLLASGIIAALLLALIGVAELWRRIGSPASESTRKLVHLGSGLVCLGLPFVIHSHWVVLGLAASMLALFVLTRRFGYLRSIHDVARPTVGAEAYPAAVFLLFFLSKDQPWIYVICILVLSVSDALASLVGHRYGRLRYEVEEEHKSVEGSLVFLASTFVVVSLPLLLWPDHPAIPAANRCLLAALYVAILATTFEAISLRGRDNLWIPLGTFFALTKILRQPANEISVQIGSLVLVFLVVGIAAWQTRIYNVGGALVIILVSYTSWSLASIHWAIVVFTGFAIHMLVCYKTRSNRLAKVRGAVGRVLPPFLMLLFANVEWNRDNLAMYRWYFGLFAAGCVAVVQQSVWNELLRRRAGRIRFRPLAAAFTSLGCCGFMTIGTWLVQSDVPFRSLYGLCGVAILIGVLHDQITSAGRTNEPESRGSPARTAITCAAIAIVAGLQSQGIIPLWNPA